MKHIPVDCEVTITITIDETLCPNVISRCVDNEDGWRDQLYNLDTPEEVIRHIAYNCIANGVTDIRRLDGWADVPEGAVTIDIDRESFYVNPEVFDV